MRAAGLVAVLLCLLASGGCRRHAAAPPPPDDDQVVWNTVGTWSGHGSAQLGTFEIERLTWRVRWEAKNESPPGSGYLHVTANSADSGRIMAELIDVKGTGSDVAYITELPHRFYLVVTSEGVDWTLTAEEPELIERK